MPEQPRSYKQWGLFYIFAVLGLALLFVVSGTKPGAGSNAAATAPTVSIPAPKATRTHTPAPTVTASVTPTRLSTKAAIPSRTPMTPTAEQSPESIDVPFLLYHHVADFDGAGARYYTSIANFEAQMQYLSQAGYHTINVSDLMAALVEGAPLPDNPVVVSFDDGYPDVYTNAFPILQKLGFTATIYLIGKDIETQAALTHIMIKKLADAGWEIGSHSMTHADLLKTNDAIEEVCTSRHLIENTLGVTVESFAYPYGSANNYVKQLVRDCGYSSGAGLGLWVTHTPGSLYFLSRREVQGDFDLEQFKKLLHNAE